MGRYVPPDQEGIKNGNQIHGKHALGARANKISQGILTVRFEVPFPIWCTHCPKPTVIGQGCPIQCRKEEGWKLFNFADIQFSNEACSLRRLDRDTDRSKEHGVCCHRGSKKKGSWGGQGRRRRCEDF